MSFFAAYKPGQARLSRMVTLISGLFLIAWGCRSLMTTLSDPGIWAKGGLALNQVFRDAPEKDAWRVNAVIFDVKLSFPFLIASALLIVLALWWWRFLNRPKWGELLIEMETELRKVAWPTPSDAWQSTLVVSGFTFAVVTTILVYDLIIKGFIELFVNG